ncbi:LysR family transcriptional regulator (plasmid) [Agrobacterium tumefaciens]|uniref:LysR family transcriptional regulator n=1 Tax=Agrobacterium tumefaciens TaxID=358 RepID=A0AAJ4TDB5_AGRTU|nr:LysR family transcriptional regulator [Agrobacterium tumefaciens]
MNVQWLEDFIALTDCMNFSKAADRRNVTQPAFSRRIKSLEEAIGADLIDRSSHRLEITEAGQIVLAAAKEIDNRLKRALREIEDAHSVASSLTFASTHALSFNFFPNWFKALPSPASSAPVHLLADNMRACERMMSDGRAQFLLCHAHPAMEIMLPEMSYKAVELAKDEIIPVSACGTDRRPVHDLGTAGTHEVPVLSFDEKSGLGRILKSTLAERLSVVKLKHAFSSHLAVALKALAMDGKGVAWVPRSLVEDEIDKGLLTLAGSEDWGVKVSIVLMRPRQRQSSLAEEFWDLAISGHEGSRLRFALERW